MKVAIKKDFLVRNVAGENVLIGCGEQINFSRMLMLNDTAARIVEMLQNGSAATDEELARQISEEYEVGYDEAFGDVGDVLAALEEQGVVVLDK